MCTENSKSNTALKLEDVTQSSHFKFTTTVTVAISSLFVDYSNSIIVPWIFGMFENCLPNTVHNQSVHICDLGHGCLCLT